MSRLNLFGVCLNFILLSWFGKCCDSLSESTIISSGDDGDGGGVGGFLFVAPLVDEITG